MEAVPSPTGDFSGVYLREWIQRLGAKGFARILFAKIKARNRFLEQMGDRLICNSYPAGGSWKSEVLKASIVGTPTLPGLVLLMMDS